MSMGFTVIGIFLFAYFIGLRLDRLGLCLVIGGILCLIYMIDLIRRELK